MSCYIGYGMLKIYYETPKGIQLRDKSYVKLEDAMPAVNTLSILSDVLSIEVKNTFTSELFYSWRRSFMLKDIVGSCISKEEIQEELQKVAYTWDFSYLAEATYSYEWSIETDKNGITTCSMKRKEN